MTLVSSFTHLDMDPAKIRKGTGVEMLRDYLEYAASGGKRVGDSVTREMAMNGFELEVKEALEAKGIPLVPQVGASRYRIDFAAMHPEKKGLQVLAIECDGASYHASPTARDRDRVRQKQLESLGWGFHRIWSTDWFMNKTKEVERAIGAYEKAVRSADTTEKQFARNLPEMQREVNGTQICGRVERPRIPKRESITDYSRAELLEWIAWIDSDGRLRTHEEKIEELLPELGFARRGTRIEGVLKELLATRRN
jgi:very-short-patch-repair endonuclease